MNTHALGGTVELDHTTTPAETATLLVRRPDSTLATATVTGVAGSQSALLDADTAGLWTYIWDSPNAGQQSGAFLVGGFPVWLPTAAEVRDELAGRQLQPQGPRMSDDRIFERLLRTWRSLATELPPVLPDRLIEPARLYVLFRTASEIEDSLHPQQASQPGSNAARLDQRAGIEIARLRRALGLDVTAGAVGGDGGSAGGFWSGNLSMGGPR